LSDPFEFSDEPIDTGFVTATVTTSESEPVREVALTPLAVQAAKALVNLPDISAVELAQMAREIAQDIGLLGTIINKHKLTQAQYDFLEKHNAFFRSTLESEIRNWQSIRSTEVRLRLQAQAALEQQMPGLATRMGNTAEKLGDAVEAAKLFARIAGVDAGTNGPASIGEKYTITIDLGADTSIVIGAQSAAPSGHSPDGFEPLRRNAQGQGQQGALRRNARGQGNIQTLPAIPER
jgi:hypothetical protein